MAGDDDDGGFWLGVVVGFAAGVVFAGIAIGLLVWLAVQIVTEGP